MAASYISKPVYIISIFPKASVYGPTFSFNTAATTCRKVSPFSHFSSPCTPLLFWGAAGLLSLLLFLSPFFRVHLMFLSRPSGALLFRVVRSFRSGGRSPPHPLLTSFTILPVCHTISYTRKNSVVSAWTSCCSCQESIPGVLHRGVLSFFPSKLSELSWCLALSFFLHGFPMKQIFFLL